MRTHSPVGEYPLASCPLQGSKLQVRDSRFSSPYFDLDLWRSQVTVFAELKICV